MALTLAVKTFTVELDATTDANIAAALNSVATTHVYGVSIIPISNTKARIVMVFD